jgi:hypothetical protein
VALLAFNRHVSREAPKRGSDMNVSLKLFKVSENGKPTLRESKMLIHQWLVLSCQSVIQTEKVAFSRESYVISFKKEWDGKKVFVSCE